VAERILVDPQELRETSTAFHNASTDVEQALGELRSAAFGLDIGCWTVGEDAQMAPKFLQAEVDGRGRVGTRDRMGNTLTRVAGAFERTDRASVQQLMGMPGWMEMAPMAAAAVGFNGTALSNLLPAPANLLDTQNWTGTAIDWEEILMIVVGAIAVACLVAALGVSIGIIIIAVLVLVGVIAANATWLVPVLTFLAIVALILALIGILIGIFVFPQLTPEQMEAALGLGVAFAPFVLALVSLFAAIIAEASWAVLVSLAILAGTNLIIGLVNVFKELFFPWLYPEDPASCPCPPSPTPISPLPTPSPP